MKSKLLVIAFALSASLMGGCGKSAPKVEHKYTIWVNSSGYYTNDYDITDGLISFETIHGAKVIATNFEIVEK